MDEEGGELNISMVHLTKRLQTIFNRAENEARSAKSDVLMPSHMLLAFLQEKTGVFGEISLNSHIDVTLIRSENINLTENSEGKIKSPYFKIPITNEVVKIIEESISYMKRYNQIYLNEGHVLRALIDSDKVDEYLSNEQKNILLNLGTTARDLIVNLDNYEFPEISSDRIRKVAQDDRHSLVEFVEKNFSTEWSHTIKGAFSQEQPSIFIALSESEEIIGFAAYDVYKDKKGYFGPMGVSINKRASGIGYLLLHHCLAAMKETGYAYAILGGAGPIEFYEKACQAVVIPLYY